MTAQINMTGMRFGRWTVQSYIGKRLWLCRCDCGAEMPRDGSSIRLGRSTSCKPCSAAANNPRRTHGGKRTRLYNIWCGMKARCLNPNEEAYPRYGGRGIRIAEGWLNDFAAFRAWALNSGYDKGLTIERVNNDGHYEPGNCKWATYAEQNRNHRRNRPILYQGRYVLIPDLAAEFGLPADVVKNRIRRYGWTIEKALTTPVAHRVKREPWVAAGMSQTTFYRKRRAAKTAMTFVVERRNIDAEG